ncbi:hypothetical protein H920_01394 [Fukomys damarensis]|uniref:Uncharacterized protein n=1 Tax=Fukomys damarensis TaxID=885580 RepID=A0A091ENK5_FUKDA|nr:hypothetical protein H920_01394 [Fukomys damarensis]
MASQSFSDDEKNPQDEVPGGPKDEDSALAPGYSPGTGNEDPVSWVFTTSVSTPLSGGVLRGSSAGSQGSVAILSGEDPAPNTETRVLEEHSSYVQGDRIPDLRFSHGGSHSGSQSEVEQASKDTDLPAGLSAQKKGRRRKYSGKRPGGKQAKLAAASPERPQLPGADAPQAPMPLPPSSARSQASVGHHSEVSPRSQEARPGAALRSQAVQAGPSSHSGTASTDRAQRLTYASGLGLCSSATGPGPAQGSGDTPPGPVHGEASGPGPTQRSRESQPGPAQRTRATPPVPVRGNASQPGPAPRSRTTPPGPVLRSSESGSGPDGRRRRSAPPCHVVRSPSLQSSLPVSGGRDPYPALQSSSVFPVREAQSPPSRPIGRALRMRASSPSPPGRYFSLRMLFGEDFSSSSSASAYSSSSSASACSSSSSSMSVSQSPSSSFAEFSGQRSSSSPPRRFGLRSIRTPSPDSLRRALMPELDALSAAISGEQEEIRGSPPSPASSVV